MTVLQDGDVRLETTGPADVEALCAIRREPAVQHRWDDVEDGFPMTDEPESVRFTVHVGGEVAGMVQYWEETEPKYRHAGIDAFIGTAFQGRGIGTTAVRLVVAHLLSLGHHRLVIDPAADNAAAIACYAKAGFTPVGITRLSERDADGQGWHDGLLMELVVAPSPQASAASIS